MQLPSVERPSNLRPSGADVAVPAAVKVIPVAPVNSSAPPKPAADIGSVVNDINPAVRAKIAQEAGTAQPSAPDPLKGGAAVDNTQRDWTMRRPAPETSAEIPKEPISKMLIQHMQALWSASAKAVEMWYVSSQQQAQNPVQVQNLNQTRNQSPADVPGVLAKEVLTYTPSKVKKNEKAEGSERSSSGTST